MICSERAISGQNKNARKTAVFKAPRTFYPVGIDHVLRITRSWSYTLRADPRPAGAEITPRRMRGGEPPLPLRASPAPTKRRKKNTPEIRVSTYRTFLPHGTRQRRPAKIRPWVPAGAADRWRAKCTDKERQFAAWEIAGEGRAGCQGKKKRVRKAA